MILFWFYFSGGHNKLIIRFSFIFFFFLFKMRAGVKFYFFIFQDCAEIEDGWLKLYLLATNHLYLVNKE